MSRVFDGDSANVLTDTGTFTLSGRIALGFFAKPNSGGYTEYTSTGGLGGFFDSSSNIHTWNVMATDGDDGTAVWSARARPRLATTPDQNLYASANDLPADVWTGVLIIGDAASQQFTLYVGSYANSFTSSLESWTADYGYDRFIIGSNYWIAGADGAFNGKIAQVAAWSGLSGAFTEAEVDGWMDLSAVPQQGSLYGYYPLETTSLADEGGSMGTLTVTGTVAFDSDSPSAPTITDFGDENHQWGETGLILTGTDFGT